MKLVLIDKKGWPIETIKGRHIQNFIRRLIHTSIKRTIKDQRDWVRVGPNQLRHKNWTDSSSSETGVRCKGKPE